MQLFAKIEDLKKSYEGVLTLSNDLTQVTVLNPNLIRDPLINSLVYNATFNSNADIVAACRWLVRATAQALGIFPSSIQPVYEAMAAGKLTGFTTPAINVRGFTYDFVAAVLRAAKKKTAFPVIFELAKSEMGYTQQTPAEYATAVIAAAIKENYQGPLYIQGDHFQISAAKYTKDSTPQVEEIKKLVSQAIEAGFYNIDIDTSTLVDLSKSTLTEQQRTNFELGALFTEYIRKTEPKDVTISIGGEIGEVGHKNSTVEELVAYMDGFHGCLKGKNMKGPSKVSVQTGTSHGGIPLADGTVAKVKLDFDTLRELSKVARERYGMSGAVQHGASTLPDELFHKFPEVKASEIHLATGFQNLILDHPQFPMSLKQEIYAHLREKCKEEWSAGQTEEQFYYKTRKKSFGPFKKQMWDLDANLKKAIFTTLQEKFEFLFDQLSVSGKRQEVLNFAKIDKVNKKAPPFLQIESPNEAKRKAS
ncbi:MAG: class II fructose-bisphosphate aldolase [Deltaproteobacteria bacterium]|nr:class II fructose-bisphosphate aldolase [Deltaproteobacteria bacterium]